MEKSGAKAYLVNTGWNGTGKRISIPDTRGIIDAILDGSIKNAPTKKIPYFDFEVPTELPPQRSSILVIHTLMQLSGIRRLRILQADSSRTSRSMRQTRLVRHSLRLVLSSDTSPVNKTVITGGVLKAPPVFSRSCGQKPFYVELISTLL